MTLEHFLNRPNQTDYENRENAEIAGNSVKNGNFRTSKHDNSVTFQDMYLIFCTHVHLTQFFHIYSVFGNFENITIIFLDFFGYFSKKSKIYKF